MNNYQIFRLDNGLRVILLQDHSPIVYCGYAINAGTRDEDRNEMGLAHFCEHASFKGTQKRKAWNIMNALEHVGGEINAFTTKQDTVYYAAILKEHAHKVVEILSDIVFCSTFPETELKKEKEVICDEIQTYNDSPAESIYDEFENLIFKGHSLGHNILGTPESVQGFDAAKAKDFTKRHYRPDNMIFFAYGDIDAKTLLRSLQKHASEQSFEVPSTKCHETANLPLYHRDQVTISKGTHLTHVMIGNRAYSRHDEKRFPLFLINNILGGPGLTSMLNMRLRERHGLVYSVDSMMTTYRDTGLWAIYFGCDPHDVEKCNKLIKKLLQELTSQEISEYKLRQAKRQIKGQLAIAADNRESFAISFAKEFLHYDRERDLNNLFKKIDAISATALQEVAQEIFDPSAISSVMIK